MPESEGIALAENTPWEYVLHIPHDLRAVTVCRRTVRLVLTMHGLIRLADVAELLATELVSNAVRHTKGPVALRMRDLTEIEPVERRVDTLLRAETDEGTYLLVVESQGEQDKEKRSSWAYYLSYLYARHHGSGLRA